jgi:hypothetical protein
MRQHTLLGERILAEAPALSRAAQPGASAG